MSCRRAGAAAGDARPRRGAHLAGAACRSRDPHRGRRADLSDRGRRVRRGGQLAGHSSHPGPPAAARPNRLRPPAGRTPLHRRSLRARAVHGRRPAGRAPDALRGHDDGRGAICPRCRRGGLLEHRGHRHERGLDCLLRRPRRRVARRRRSPHACAWRTDLPDPRQVFHHRRADVCQRPPRRSADCCIARRPRVRSCRRIREFILRKRHTNHQTVRAAARGDDARSAELVRAQLQPDEHRRGDAGRLRPEQRALPDGDQLLGHGGVVRAERRDRREDVQRRQRRAACRLGKARTVHRGVPREDGESRVSHQPRAAGDEGPRRQRPAGSAAGALPRDGCDQPPVSLAAISLCALILALALSCTTAVNVGVLAIVLAWIVGVYFGGMPVEQIIGGFPSSLFLTLAGLTLLFAQAQVNGTLDRLTHRAVRGAAGAPGVIPFIFFGLTFTLASIGPGHIAATALMAPLAMAAAGRYKISPFLMAIMVANGASAGSLSPIAPTGVVVEGITMKMGLIDVRWTIFLNNFIAHTTIAWAGYLLLGGWRLLLAPRNRLRQGYGGQERALYEIALAPGKAASYETEAPNGAGITPGPAVSESIGRQIADNRPLEWRHWLTCAVIAALIFGVIVFNINVGLGAFAGAVVLTLARAANEKAAVLAMPWGVVIMVCGVTLLVSLLERTGGMALFADFLGRLATPETSAAAAAER